jgi:glutamate-ammonia-ligase adenylyltransferase
VVERYRQRLAEHPEFLSSGLAALLQQDPQFAAEVDRVWACSEFIANHSVSQPGLLMHVHGARHHGDQDYRTLFDSLTADLEDSSYAISAETLKQRFRRLHRQEFVTIIWRDLCGYSDVHGICAQMSRLADGALDAALDLLHHWSSREWGQPRNAAQPQRMVVIGMGKLGANELNVSSDIDLIFAYPASGDVQPPENHSGAVLTNQQFFIRLGQRLIDVLDSTTPEGFLFRVDMRLRPYGSEGALALSFDAMEDYYQNQGRDWERYAMIKARAVAGDIQQGRELLKRLRPFVYRRYLDFAMFESLRDMKVQINKQARRGKLSEDIKLGSGGIREVEFIVQALQLVHGGRDRLLQQPSLTRALLQLVAGDYLPQAAADELLAHYEFLRNLEHKLQILDNQQTQRLPRDELAQQRVAFAMGFPTWTGLLEELSRVRGRVAAHFRDVLRIDDEDQEQQQASRDWLPLWKFDISTAAAIRLLAEEGYEDPQASLDLLGEFRKERRFLTLPAESRQRLDNFMPLLLDAAADAPFPSLCLSRVMPLIESVSRRTAYLVLLMENPGALHQLVTYCTASPLISDYLARFPVLLDELLNVLDVPPDRARLADELRLQLLRIDGDSFEEQLECLRYFKQSHLLQVAAAEVSGKMHLMKVSDYLTFCAEVILDAVLAICWQHMVQRHGYPVHADGSHGHADFAIIGYGKLGGIELSYNSDLDLVFLHRAALEEDTVTSSEQQSINSRAFYIKLAQRIIMMLGTYTMSGKLYEVDMRLRPSGESGLLVSSLDSFQEYQLRQAWTWEHQALVRARGVAGNPDLLKAFVAVRRQILSRQRDRETLARDVTDMRKRMRKELGSHSSSATERLAFQVKQGAGGIVDIEFLVQFLVLAHAEACPDLLTWTDNYRILEAARDCQLLNQTDMQHLIDAYLELRAVSHQLALQQAESPQAAAQLAERQAQVTRIWHEVFGAHA